MKPSLDGVGANVVDAVTQAIDTITRADSTRDALAMVPAPVESLMIDHEPLALPICCRVTPVA
jgi:hypothetical protein